VKKLNKKIKNILKKKKDFLEFILYNSIIAFLWNYVPQYGNI